METWDIFHYSSNFQLKINISEKELRFQEMQHVSLRSQHKQQRGTREGDKYKHFVEAMIKL